jgi:low affinity Fe/Cu permease
MTVSEISEPDGQDDRVAEVSRRDSSQFRRLSRRFRSGTGSSTAAAIVLGVASAWLVLGGLTDYPRWWELLVTAGVPFLTLLMVVLLQHTQNHDDRATQLKLDELIRATRTATNRMMTIEDASRAHLDHLHDEFQAQADSASQTGNRVR